MRVGPSAFYGLDFTAVILTARLRGVAGPLLAEVLPGVEAAAIAALKGDDE